MCSADGVRREHVCVCVWCGVHVCVVWCKEGTCVCGKEGQ